jgi:hypothetical protein
MNAVHASNVLDSKCASQAPNYVVPTMTKLAYRQYIWCGFAEYARGNMPCTLGILQRLWSVAVG